MRHAPRLTRRFITAGFALTLAPGVGLAEPLKRHPVGYLSAGSHTSKNIGFFRESMRALGYGDEELSIESRYAEGDNERLPALAAELVHLSPETIVTGSNSAAVAAKQATSSIPIVAVFTADPVGTGLATSIARPGATSRVYPTSWRTPPAKNWNCSKPLRHKRSASRY